VAVELAFLSVLMVLGAGAVPGLRELLAKAELATQDLRYHVRGPLPVSGVCVVGIDDDSLQTRAWPWSRSVYAGFVRRLNQYGARAVVLDILLPEARDANGDREFAAAMREVGNVFLVFHGRQEKGRSAANEEAARHFAYDTLLPPAAPHFRQLLPPLPLFAVAAAGGGHPECAQGPDAKYRSAWAFVGCREMSGAYPHVALDVARYALGLQRKEIRYDDSLGAVRLGPDRLVPVDPNGRVQLNFPGPDATFPRYSFVAVEKGEVRPEAFRDQVVLVGHTAPGTPDLRPQPFSEKQYYGVETNATLVWNLLSGNSLRQTTYFAYAFSVLLVGALLGLVVTRLAPLPGGLFAAGLALAHCGVAYYLFVARHFVLEVAPQVLTIALGYVLVTGYRLATEEREKRRIRETFSLYVAPSVVEEILEDPHGLDLDRSERQTVTILFSDIRGFTTVSEQLPVEEVKALLNEYFSVMNDIIFDHRGTIDKFIGDAIMVLFNAPTAQRDHAELAVRTALAMRQGLAHLQEHWRAQGRPAFGIGIGINTGEAVVGNLGSPTRLEYTAIGDQVNLASRLEGLTRDYDADILISASTYELVKDAVQARKLEVVRVKGRDEPVTLYAVDALAGEGGTEAAIARPEQPTDP